MTTEFTDEGRGEVDPPQDIEYDITIKGNGLTLERTISEPTALQVLTVVLGGPITAYPQVSGVPAPASITPDAPPAPAVSSGAGTQPNITVGEYIANVEAKGNPAKIAAIAAYLKEYRGATRFSRDDIKSEFPHAGEKVPGNFPRDFRDAVRMRWIAADHTEKDQFYVTGTGLSAVSAKFAGAAKPGSTRKRATARKKSASAGA